MGIGREIGEQVRHWVGSGELNSLPPQALVNRLIDAAGASRRLHGPLQDLGRQPLFLQLLREQQPAKARATLQALKSELAEVYSSGILTELVQLLEAAIGIPGVSQATARPGQTPATDSSSIAHHWFVRPWRLARTLRPLAPGLALGAGSSLVLAWFGVELGRLVFEPLGWSAGVVLLLVLGAAHLLTSRMIRPWRTAGLLDRASAVNPRQAWRWVSAPWLHASDKEVLLNTVVLAVVLFSTPLPLREVVLRYALTSLTCLALAVQASRWCHLRRIWGGSSGVVASLLSLDSTLSLLRWQEQTFDFEVGPLRIPVWVLLWSWVTIQMAWSLPRRHTGDRTRAWQRVVSCCWFWGLALGAAWGVALWLVGLSH